MSARKAAALLLFASALPRPCKPGHRGFLKCLPSSPWAVPDRAPSARTLLGRDTQAGGGSGPCRRQWGVFLAQIPLEKQLVNPTLSALPSSLAGSSGCCLGNPQWGATALGVPVTHTQVPAKGFRAPSSSGASLQPLCGLPGSGMPPVRWRSGLRGRPRGFGLSKVSEPGFQHTTVPQ